MEVIGGETSNFTWFAEVPGQQAASPRTPGNGEDGPNDAAVVWAPLRRADQWRVEAAYTRDLERRSAAVAVEGHRVEVRLEERLLVDLYGASPPRPPRAVRRVLWNWCAPNSTRWQPYSEEVDAEIEEAYTLLLHEARNALLPSAPKLPQHADLVQTVQLPGGQAYVHLKLNYHSTTKPTYDAFDTGIGVPGRHWELVAEQRPMAWWKEAQSVIMRRPTTVRRGYGEVPLRPGEAEEEMLGQDIGRLLVLVHGLSNGDPSREPCVDTFRRHTHVAQLQAAGYERRPDGRGWDFTMPADEALNVPKTEVIEVSWAQYVQLASGSLESLAPVSGDGSLARHLVDGAIQDAMFFAQARRRDAMLAAIEALVEAALARFAQSRPDFAGDVMFLGQGLGGCALFQLFRRGSVPRIRDSKPKALFLLGSPLGAYLRLADDDEASSATGISLPGDIRVLNVFHPADRNAYRLEPLLPPSLELEYHSAERVPAGDARQIAKRLTTPSIMPAWMNGGTRVDWVLPTSCDSGADGAPADVEEALALRSRSYYYESQQVASFVQGACASIVAPGMDGSLDDFLSGATAWQPASDPGGAIASAEAGTLDLASFRSGAALLQEGVSKSWETTGAAAAAARVAGAVSQKCKETGATDAVMGTYQAASGVVGAARAVGGTVRLLSNVAGGVGGAVGMARAVAAQQQQNSG
eukprot:TRINITY_DN37852_c0_g1_i1.p1 TRINITY_DN37852_c0_g1~~TRINITY_DN37852_c0_g1_i1.p1  ORF type:complete len:723 (-),score=147.62 TRINITY_DN37852_c0_g1_i1:173-2257(-)